MQGTDAFPCRGVRLEIAARSLRTVVADRFQARRVTSEQLFRLDIDSGAQFEQSFGPFRLRQLQIDPAAFFAAADQARIGKYPHMPRYARLALAEQLRQLTNGQLHGP